MINSYLNDKKPCNKWHGKVIYAQKNHKSKFFLKNRFLFEKFSLNITLSKKNLPSLEKSSK
jgi:hypothetical protein